MRQHCLKIAFVVPRNVRPISKHGLSPHPPVWCVVRAVAVGKFNGFDRWSEMYMLVCVVHGCFWLAGTWGSWGLKAYIMIGSFKFQAPTGTRKKYRRQEGIYLPPHTFFRDMFVWIHLYRTVIVRVCCNIVGIVPVHCISTIILSVLSVVLLMTMRCLAGYCI